MPRLLKLRLRKANNMSTTAFAFKSARISFNATTEQPIGAVGAGTTMRIRRLRLSVAGATNITIKDAASGNILEIIQFPAAGLLVLDSPNAFDEDRAYWSSANGGQIVLQSSAAVQVEGRVTYSQDTTAL